MSTHVDFIAAFISVRTALDQGYNGPYYIPKFSV